MGQEIVYCYKCQKRILGGEFAKGQAFQLRNNVCCAACAAELLKILPPQEREQLQKAMVQATQERQASSSANHSALPTVTPAASRALSSSSTRAKALSNEKPSSTGHIQVLHPRGGSAPDGSSAKIGIGIGAAVLVAGALAVVFSGGGHSARIAVREDRTAPAPAASPISRPPESSPESAEAKSAVQKARDFAKTNPQDLQGQITLWEQARWASEKTPFHPEVVRELAQLKTRRAEIFPKELAALADRAAPLLKGEEFKAASDLFQSARNRYDAPDWAGSVDNQIREIYAKAAALSASVKEAAVAAQNRGDAAEVAKIRARVQKWGFPEFGSDLEASLAAAVPPPPPPPPPKPLSKEAQAYRTRWEAAAARATARDYAAGLQELAKTTEPVTDPDLRAESAADQDLFRGASALLAEAREILARTAKGQKLSLDVWNESGAAERIEGPLLRSDANQLVLKQGDGVETIEWGEITPASLAELYGGRPQRKPEADARAGAAFCLFEGDAEGARRLLGAKAAGLPEKYWAYAASLRQPALLEREAAARRLFSQIDEGVSDYSKIPASLQACKALLAEHASTTFVARNRASIAARLTMGKEYLFTPDLMKAGGSFKTAKGSKVESYWSSDRDGDAAKAAENFVEVAYPALPDTEYRCWVYAGGCCLETFTFGVQASGLTTPNPRAPKETLPAEPGSAAAAPVKVSLSLKKTHSMHLGPKSAAHWDWIWVPLPKDAAPGLRKIRLVTDQKGFSVAFIVVSAKRSAPPAEAEVKDFEKLRAERMSRSPSLEAKDPDLVGYWPLDEGSGTAPADVSGRGHAPAKITGAAWVPGRFGSGLRFDGVNSFLELPSAPDLDSLNAGNYTVAAWFKPEMLPPGTKDDGNDTYYSLVIKSGCHEGTAYSRDGHFYSWHWLAGQKCAGSGGGRIYAPGVFYHVAHVVDRGAGKFQVYINGQADGTGAFTPNAEAMNYGNTTWKVGIGAPWSGQYRWCAKAVIDEVRLYSRALSAQDVAALYSARPRPRGAEPAGASADGRPWTPVFDGQTLDFLVGKGNGGWKMENGAAVKVPEIDDAAQTASSFSDGEVRIRFEVRNLVSHVWFIMRQDGPTGHRVSFQGADLRALGPGPHELIFVCQGESTTATLNGKPVSVQEIAKVKSGKLQFNGASDCQLRILSLDTRPLR